MNEQNTLAGKTAADLVQSIAAALFGDAGAGITDLIALANRVQAAAGKPQAGEVQGDALTDAEIDENLNALYRHLLGSGQHNGGMCGIAWDRAVYRAALAAWQTAGQEPRAWLIHWTHQSGQPEATTSASRVEAVSMLTNPPRIEPLYAAPPAQAVGSGWSGWATQYPGKMPVLRGTREIADLNHYPYEGQRLLFLAEQPVQVVKLDMTAQEREWIEYAIAHMRDDSEPEDLTCADALERMLARIDGGKEVPNG